MLQILYALCIILYFMGYFMYYFICFICSVKLCFIFAYEWHGQNLQYSSLVYRQNSVLKISPIGIRQTSEWWFGVTYAKFIIAIVFVLFSSGQLL